MSRELSRGFRGRIKVRILRPWRGYKAGSVIAPVGALRKELLRSTDQLGNHFAEELPPEVEEVVPPVEEVVEAVDEHEDTGKKSRKKGWKS